MSDIPPLIDGQYISNDGSAHDAYSEAYAANLRLAERKKRYGKISNPWNAVDLLDENDISFITYLLATVWFMALGLFGYNQQWWRFVGTLTLFIPIIGLEVLIQRIPKDLRKVLLITTIVSGLSFILFLRLK